jgi:hypothetical protein
MVIKHEEMKEGFRNWNNDDSRTEGLDRRMKYHRLLEERRKKKSKDRQIKLYGKAEKKWKAITKILKKICGIRCGTGNLG